MAVPPYFGFALHGFGNLEILLVFFWAHPCTDCREVLVSCCRMSLEFVGDSRRNFNELVQRALMRIFDI